MGDFTQADMTGAFFKNERKTADSDQPDYQGSVTIKGVKFALGGWIKKAKSGKTYMSLSVRPWKDSTQKQSEAPKKPEPEFKDDEIPW